MIQDPVDPPRGGDVIADRSPDPYGIAPPGQNPDAYPGSVEPLTLAPPTPAPAKPRARKGPRPDIDPATLGPEARAAYETILVEPTFGPITDRPAEAARDFANLYPRLDLAQAIREIGTKIRASDRTYKNGAATLANWLPNSRCYRTTPLRPPAASEVARLRRPVGPHDSIEDQIQHFVRIGMNVPPPLIALREKELAAEAAAKAAATAPQETERLALNVLLRADKAGADALRDPAAEQEDPF